MEEFFTKDDVEVATILTTLHDVIAESEFRSLFPSLFVPGTLETEEVGEDSSPSSPFWFPSVGSIELGKDVNKKSTGEVLSRFGEEKSKAESSSMAIERARKRQKPTPADHQLTIVDCRKPDKDSEHRAGHYLLPDLNIPLEEVTTVHSPPREDVDMDERRRIRASAAEARQRRRQLRRARRSKFHPFD